MTVPFFVIVVMFGAYFIQNLTVAILKAKFDSASDKILEELKLEEKVTNHELVRTQEIYQSPACIHT